MCWSRSVDTVPLNSPMQYDNQPSWMPVLTFWNNCSIRVLNFDVFSAVYVLDETVAFRLDYFKTWLSNTEPASNANLDTSKCTLCLVYGGTVAASTTAYVNCPLTLAAFRYVIIEENRPPQDLCVMEIIIYTGKNGWLEWNVHLISVFFAEILEWY
jgi:hypothetical protein